jgi:hypothetical protein
MPDQKTVVMTFGKHRGLPVSEVPTHYLQWVKSECYRIDPNVRAAVLDELDRRGRVRGSGRPEDPGQVAAPDQQATSATTDSVPTGGDRAVVFRMLSDALSCGVRLVARGEGAVHAYGRPSSNLRARLLRHQADIDALAAHLRWASPDRTRITPATQLMAQLRAEGRTLTPLPSGQVAISPEPEEEALAVLSAGGRLELWARLVLSLPDLAIAPATPSQMALPPNTLAGLHKHCLERVETSASGPQERGNHWKRWADTVAAVRAGQVGFVSERTDLASYCMAQGSSLELRGQSGAARKWRRWADALRAA